MKKAVIFDMDGVLVDSQPLHFQADLYSLKSYDIFVELDTVIPNAGMSNPDRWAKYKRDFQLMPSIETLIENHVATVDTFLEKEALQPIAGITPLLEYLWDKKIPCAVASSSSYAFVNRMLEKLQIQHYFSIIQSGEDLSQSKPAPDIFLKTAQRLQCTPSQCVVIEDSTAGVLAAKNADMFCIAYQNPTSGPQEIAIADWVIDDFGQLLTDTSWLL